MEIHYLDEKLETLCTDDRKAQRELGKDGFKKLRRRLADLEAARSLGDLPAGRPHRFRAIVRGSLPSI